MADAQASGACGRKVVWVQVPSPASKKGLKRKLGTFFDVGGDLDPRFKVSSQHSCFVGSPLRFGRVISNVPWTFFPGSAGKRSTGPFS